MVTFFSTVICLHFIDVWFGILEWNKNFTGVTGEKVNGIFHLSQPRKPRNSPILWETHIINQKNHLTYWNESHSLHLATSGQNHFHLSSIKYILIYRIQLPSTLFLLMHHDSRLGNSCYFSSNSGAAWLEWLVRFIFWCPKIFLWYYQKALSQLTEDFFGST